MRNTFGQIWGQTQLPEKRVDTGEPWTGEISRFFAVGGNVRASGSYTDIPNQKSLTSFDIDSARLYLDVRAILDRLSIYVDQKVAPGGSTNNEAYARLSFANQRYYVKAGQLYLPLWRRLQDDFAFTRQVDQYQLRNAGSRRRSWLRERVHGRRSSPSPTALAGGLSNAQMAMQYSACAPNTCGRSFPSARASISTSRSMARRTTAPLSPQAA